MKKITQSNNVKVSGSNKTKGLKQYSKYRLREENISFKNDYII